MLSSAIFLKLRVVNYWWLWNQLSWSWAVSFLKEHKKEKKKKQNTVENRPHSISKILIRPLSHIVSIYFPPRVCKKTYEKQCLRTIYQEVETLPGRTCTYTSLPSTNNMITLIVILTREKWVPISPTIINTLLGPSNFRQKHECDREEGCQHLAFPPITKKLRTFSCLLILQDPVPLNRLFNSPSFPCLCLVTHRVRPSMTPWTVAHQAPLSMDFSRQES